MGKKRESAAKRVSLAQLGDYLPSGLLELLAGVARSRGQQLFLVGGTVRDCLAGRFPEDLDCTVAVDAAGLLRSVAASWGAGTVVPLGVPDDDTCRLALAEIDLDVTGFRNGASNIENDLKYRDITINALAVSLDVLLAEGSAPVIDPLNGCSDLRDNIVRHCPGAFIADPLRLLRVFRFAAELGFSIEERTRQEVAGHAASITRCAVERIAYECERIMVTDRAARAFRDMADCGVLAGIIPELWLGNGVQQPACHHLDVLGHNLETLRCLEQLLDTPERYFPDSFGPLRRYAEEQANRSSLKWAALLHDVGKPAAQEISGGAGHRRITFYRHDEHGASMVEAFGRRMLWGKRKTRCIASLIGMHMHPFHLCNVARRDGSISRRALLNITRRSGEERSGLFLLAMADTLAGKGEGRPPDMEQELASLHRQVEAFYDESVSPVLSGVKLLTGNDLIATLGLKPGPLFRELLEEVETAAVEGRITTREEALQLIRDYLTGDVER